MSDASKIIKQGTFHNTLCGQGTVTLREDSIQVDCPRGSTSFQFMLHEISRFRATNQGFYIDRFYIRLNNSTEWIKLIKHALDAKGIQYEETGFRII